MTLWSRATLPVTVFLLAVAGEKDVLMIQKRLGRQKRLKRMEEDARNSIKTLTELREGNKIFVPTTIDITK